MVPIVEADRELTRLQQGVDDLKRDQIHMPSAAVWYIALISYCLYAG